MSRRMRLWEAVTGDPVLDNYARKRSQVLNKRLAGPGACIPLYNRKKKKQEKRDMLIGWPSAFYLSGPIPPGMSSWAYREVLSRKTKQIGE